MFPYARKDSTSLIRQKMLDFANKHQAIEGALITMKLLQD